MRAALLSSGLEYPQTTRDGEPRARVGAQDRRRARARGRARRSLARRRAGCRPACSTASACSASSVSTARSGRSPARSRSSTRSRAPGVEHVIVPAANAAEAALVPGVHVRVARTLGELHACLKGEAPWPDPPDPRPRSAATPTPTNRSTSPTSAGSTDARLALAVAAAGGHHLLLVGPPGVGKTMLARRLPTILPALDPRRSARGHQASTPPPGTHRGPALRTIHRSARRTTARRRSRSSAAAARRVRPGEITLAHRGVLFLDELPEFPTSVLEALRQPLEERVVRDQPRVGHARVPRRLLARRVREPVPVRPQRRRSAGAPTCSARATPRRLSAPLLDRFDLRLERRGRRDRAGRVVGRGRGAGRGRRRAPDAPAARDTPGGATRTSRPARSSGYAALDPTTRDAWLGECRLRRLTGRGAARIRAGRAHARRPRRPRRDRRRRHRPRGLAARGRVVSTDRTAGIAATTSRSATPNLLDVMICTPRCRGACSARATARRIRRSPCCDRRDARRDADAASPTRARSRRSARARASRW